MYTSQQRLETLNGNAQCVDLNIGLLELSVSYILRFAHLLLVGLANFRLDGGLVVVLGGQLADLVSASHNEGLLLLQLGDLFLRIDLALHVSFVEHMLTFTGM